MKLLPKTLNYKKMLVALCIGLAVAVTFALLSNRWVQRQATGQVFDQLSELPQRDIALVLGAGRYTTDHYLNPYFTYRMEAAAELYHAGKVKHLLLSGDNSRHGYNEPEDMKKALIARGVPADAITLDFAGFRTLDSVVRCKAVFQQRRVIIVSQAFHNARALAIANQKGLDAIAYNARTPSFHKHSNAPVRELLARSKAVLDLFVLRTQPKFYGPKIELPIT